MDGGYIADLKWSEDELSACVPEPEGYSDKKAVESLIGSCKWAGTAVGTSPDLYATTSDELSNVTDLTICLSSADHAN